MTLEQVVSALQWVGALSAGGLLSMLGYFLSDAHKKIKTDLDKKADLTVIDASFNRYRADLAAIEARYKEESAAHRDELNKMDERHKEETSRLERQYEVRFAGVVAQFSERINSMERNMSDKLELILSVVNRRHT